MIGCVDFSKFTNSEGDNEMYEALINDISTEAPDLLEFLLLDDDNHTVWIVWYELGLA